MLSFTLDKQLQDFVGVNSVLSSLLPIFRDDGQKTAFVALHCSFLEEI